ncbi:hypothetical protein N7449_010678 [Penicillium cf. viridicatum]|uniref:Uncharacterized protein n=1 Tax=Penicillium cf. viridicatum TaxID=2972119 RepID=A0A9W9J0W1_9EURO|nr:hypothetical protein N7449_010678 [Penicillium cf. viridicatum]
MVAWKPPPPRSVHSQCGRMDVHKVVVANRLLLVIYFITNYIHIDPWGLTISYQIHTDRSYPPLYITISILTEYRSFFSETESWCLVYQALIN